MPCHWFSANQTDGVCLWDVRKPGQKVLEYGSALPVKNRGAMSASFNANGTRILALGRRKPAILYNIDSPITIFEFDNTGKGGMAILGIAFPLILPLLSKLFSFQHNILLKLRSRTPFCDGPNFLHFYLPFVYHNQFNKFYQRSKHHLMNQHQRQIA